MATPPRPPMLPPPRAAEIHRLVKQYVDAETQGLAHEVEMLRGEMRTSFAALERHTQGTARGISRSDPPRGYTLPMTPTGSVLIDQVQDMLDKLQRERDAAAAVAKHEREKKEAADARLTYWTKLLAVAIPAAGLLGGVISHFMHH